MMRYFAIFATVIAVTVGTTTGKNTEIVARHETRVNV